MAQKYSDVTFGKAEAVFNKLGGMEGVEKFLRGEIEMVAKAANFITATYKQVVNYDLSVKELLKAGKYDWINEDITDKNFPSSENGEKEVEFGMFHFKRGMSSEDAIAEMKKAGYRRPATMKELLSFGKNNPDLQREFPIVALGSVAKLNGHRRVSCLVGDGSGRDAYLDYFDGGWHDIYRFLAVRN